ncbi:MAG: hypothetical protein NC221_03755 [Duncaniella sp.]|nr:hypothetical protein [Duncaniella sp.]
METIEPRVETHNYDITDLSDISGLTEVSELIQDSENIIADSANATDSIQVNNSSQPIDFVQAADSDLPIDPVQTADSDTSIDPVQTADSDTSIDPVQTADSPQTSSKSNHLTKTPLRPFELLRYENTRHSESPAAIAPDPTSQVLLRNRRSVWSI